MSSGAGPSPRPDAVRVFAGFALVAQDSREELVGGPSHSMSVELLFRHVRHRDNCRNLPRGRGRRR
eukprot:COSAG06_NODE_5598_length_3370_cov_18.827881_2_plen_66_part_00